MTILQSEKPMLDIDQLNRLLALLDSGKYRPWEWIMWWLNGEVNATVTIGGVEIPTSDIDAVISAFEGPRGWEE